MTEELGQRGLHQKQKQHTYHPLKDLFLISRTGWGG